MPDLLRIAAILKHASGRYIDAGEPDNAGRALSAAHELEELVERHAATDLETLAARLTASRMNLEGGIHAVEEVQAILERAKARIDALLGAYPEREEPKP